MTTPPPDATDLGWDAVSPAIGPLPAIHVHVPAPIGGTMSDIPADLRYSQDHLWVRPDPGAGLVRVGVTDFAQRSLGDVVEVTLPGLGETIKAGQACGDIESVKSVNDLVAPVAGTVRARNDDLAGTPEVVNTDPYGQGWMFEVEIDPSTLDQQLASLMDAGAYRRLAGA
jgi:glycine cleavage system H protein